MIQKFWRSFPRTLVSRDQPDLLTFPEHAKHDTSEPKTPKRSFSHRDIDIAGGDQHSYDTRADTQGRKTRGYPQAEYFARKHEKYGTGAI